MKFFKAMHFIPLFKETIFSHILPFQVFSQKKTAAVTNKIPSQH